MDRKTEIDRYMMGGPFSWPAIIELLNRDFIPLRAVPDEDLQAVYELRPYKFVEPGFVILESNGTLRQRVDRLTTLHPKWIFHIIAGDSSRTFEQVDQSIELKCAWANARADRWGEPFPEPKPGDAEAVEKSLLRGMAQFRNGEHSKARETWRALQSIDADHPLTWKALAEAEGFGPFVRGFEVLGELPERCYRAGIESVGSSAPANVYDSTELWKHGIDFLLGMQNDRGGYEDCDYDFGGTDSLPNVYVAVTSLVGMSLIESLSNAPLYRSDEIRSAIKRCIRYVTDENNINDVDRDEILWAHAYRVRFLARWLAEDGSQKQHLQEAVVKLENLQSERGNWYHEYANPFVTATALCALHEARRSGAAVDMDKVEAGLKSLLNDRAKNGSFPYTSRRSEGANDEGSPIDIQASAGRMPVCELALRYWDRASHESLVRAIEHSFEHHDLLSSALKYDDHTSRLAYGGFFFWYDMQGRSEAISAVTDQRMRDEMIARQHRIVLSLPEIDGCFVDSHELGRCYGTAMALLCLAKATRAAN
jgi:hypothetical protein